MLPGYNVSITVGGKTLIGRTQDDLTIAATVKESITKDDAGVKKYAVTGHDVTFRCAGLIELSDGGTPATIIDRDDILALVMKKSSDTGGCEVAVQYLATGGATYGGTAIITGYSESTAADPDTDSTYSLDLRITGAFAIVS
jgi:hypothetical protein